MKEMIRAKILDILSVVAFLQERCRKRNNQKIRVGFMCQYIPAWNKSLPVYNKLKNDDRFEVFLLCVPNRIENRQLVNSDDLTNDTYDYFIEQGYEPINTLIGKNEWLDLKELNLDYIFFTRPYNSYMPKAYSSRRVSAYAKICVLLYAMTITKSENIMINVDFFRNVYCYFAETSFIAAINKKQLKLTHKLGLQKTVCYGMPALEQILLDKEKKGEIWNFSKNEFRVMWTPRWTTDIKLGGSNFFVYRDALLKYAEKERDIDFLFRPHPLSFPNFIKTGEMTKEEVDVYREKINKMENVFLDEEKEYVSTMWESSVLVSDLSGMMPEYFVTGKPIIFCGSNMYLEPAEHFAKILEGCYTVYNEQELFECLERLKAGDDPLKEKRAQIIGEVFGSTLGNASQMIVKELVKNKR